VIFGQSGTGIDAAAQHDQRLDPCAVKQALQRLGISFANSFSLNQSSVSIVCIRPLNVSYANGEAIVQILFYFVLVAHSLKLCHSIGKHLLEPCLGIFQRLSRHEVIKGDTDHALMGLGNPIAVSKPKLLGMVTAVGIEYDLQLSFCQRIGTVPNLDGFCRCSNALHKSVICIKQCGGIVQLGKSPSAVEEILFHCLRAYICGRRDHHSLDQERKTQQCQYQFCFHVFHFLFSFSAAKAKHSANKIICMRTICACVRCLPGSSITHSLLS